MKRAYESMVIVRDDVTGEERDEVFQKIIKTVEGLEGKVLESKVWAQERSFSFPIRASGAGRKRYFKGCYWLINYELDTTKLPDLKETVRLEEKILRVLYLNKNDVAQG